MTSTPSQPPTWGPRYKEAAAYYRELLKTIFRGKRWLLFGGPVVGLVGIANELKHLSGERPFLLGSCLGTGDLPDSEFAEVASFDLQVGSLREEFATYEALLREIPDEVAQAIDAWDPEGNARATGLIALSVIHSVAGRPSYGQRQPEWLALEDKTRIDEFWRAAKVECLPCEIVSLEGDAVRAAIERLGCSSGAVLAGDAREGIHGGAQGVIPVWTDPHLASALATLRQHHSTVRVMPYIEGQPCSIHGVVFPQGVSVFRPVEMVTLVDRRAGRFRYAGLGTFWDPADSDREYMRALARRVGETLRANHGYRGPFTIDGVLGSDGFRPTELNSRFGAGLGPLAFSVPTLPLSSLCLAATEGESLDFRPEWLEAIVIEEADQRRSGRGSAWLERPCEQLERHNLVETSDGYRTASQGEIPDATATMGSGPMGGFFSFVPSPDRLKPGPALAPRVARAFEWANRELGTAIPGGQAAQGPDG